MTQKVPILPKYATLCYAKLRPAHVQVPSTVGNRHRLNRWVMPQTTAGKSLCVYYSPKYLPHGTVILRADYNCTEYML